MIPPPITTIRAACGGRTGVRQSLVHHASHAITVVALSKRAERAGRSEVSPPDPSVRPRSGRAASDARADLKGGAYRQCQVTRAHP